MQLFRAPIRALRFARKLARASGALTYAEQREAPGTTFARFGRQIGLRLLRRGSQLGFQYLVTPVSITRYFEFEFVSAHIPRPSRHCLDVSSPRLFSLHSAAAHPEASVDMLNPDVEDAETSRSIVARLGFSNVRVRSDPVSSLKGKARTYDCIWSISVVEHIDGDDGDMEAMQLMYRALRPGGRLIVTVPVDRTFWREYRDRDYYGTSRVATPSGSYFFQRLYDEKNVRGRLVNAVGQEPTHISWFGERVAGTFYAYERRWIELGSDETIEDPRRIADDYGPFRSWAEMPGFGVCGLVFDKPTHGSSGSTS